MTKIFVTLLAVGWIGAGAVFAAEQTWTGKLADSLCGTSHERMSAMVVPPLSEKDCATECIKAGGKYVFVDEKDKILQIANQDFAGLPMHAGQAVKITGEMKGDSIT